MKQIISNVLVHCIILVRYKNLSYDNMNLPMTILLTIRPIRLLLILKRRFIKNAHVLYSNFFNMGLAEKYILILSLTHFTPLVSLYPLKTYTNPWFPDIFREYRKRTLVCYGLMCSWNIALRRHINLTNLVSTRAHKIQCYI